MKSFNALAVAVLLVVAAPFAVTEQTQGAGANSAAGVKVDGLVSAMSQDEVRKIDKDSQKITLEHGEIKNLGQQARHDDGVQGRRRGAAGQGAGG